MLYLFALLMSIVLNLGISWAAHPLFSKEASRFGFCVGTIAFTLMTWVYIAANGG